MADKNILEQMLESLVNGDQAKAEELFHEYVVTKSREVYEGLIEDELQDEEVEEATDEDDDAVEEAKDEDDDDAVEEAKDEDEDESVEEDFEDIAIEADDDMMGGDPTDQLAGKLDGEEGPEEGEESEDELFQDLEAIVDELQAKFNELKGHEEGEGEEEGEDEMKDAFEPELATVREYVEKVPAGHGAEKKGAAEKADNTKSVVDNMKNDMGGTTANILSGRNGQDAGEAGAAGGQLKGNGVLKGKPQEDNAGNINVPGGKAGSAFSKKEPGHGAEKKGAAEKADNTNSLFRGKR